MSLDFARYRYVLRKKRVVDGSLMRHRNVVAVGVGLKAQADETVEDISITVSVTEKVPASQLPESEIIPSRVEGVATDVVRTGPIFACAGLDRRGALRPARPGVSIGHYQTTAGTLGCLVRRDGETYILSNNHVLACINRAQPGDPIYQPGPADGGTASQQLAELADFIPLRLPEEATAPGPEGCLASLLGLLSGKSAALEPTEPPPNQVDVALARPLDPALVRADVLDVGPLIGVAEPVLGGRVRKSGRTTGLTEATITQMDVTADVIYGDQRVRFIDQVMTGPLSRPGDSGSPVVDEGDRMVGLLFSGSDYVGLFTPITYIMAALNVEVVTG